MKEKELIELIKYCTNLLMKALEYSSFDDSQEAVTIIKRANNAVEIIKRKNDQISEAVNKGLNT